VLAELENVCDRVLLLHRGEVRLAGDVHELRNEHTLVRGRAHEDTADGLPPGLDRSTVVESGVTGRLVTALVQEHGTPPFAWDPDRWETATPSVEELLLGRLRAAHATGSGSAGGPDGASERRAA
jgi:ABC-2 type transport system ATP-binding protein